MDAAVAAAAVLAVVEPMMTGIGGDAFFLYYENDTRTVFALNGSGRSPAGLSAKQVRTSGEEAIALDSWMSVTVPGAVDAWCEGMRRFGRLPLAEVLQPAIHYAAEGFPVTEVVHSTWTSYADRLLADSQARKTYLVDDRAPELGSVFRNPRLADSLAAIADRGRDAFYTGAIAEEIVRYAQKEGGYLAEEDFADHHSEWVEPLSVTYRGYEVLQIPPNGQGIGVLLMLNLLEGYDLPSLGHNSPEYLHLLVEVKKLAYADLHRWVADSEPGVELPIAKLLSKDYAAERIRAVDPNRAANAVESGIERGGDTVYLTAIDPQGNSVSFINSLFDAFGAKKVGGETGILLQNRGCGFSLEPGHLNEYAPGKRPYHTILPGMVRSGGKLYLSYGLMGGPMQPQGHVQFLLSHLDFGLGIQEAVDTPRWRHTTGTELLLEHGTPRSTIEALRLLGHTVVPSHGSLFGGAQAILVDPGTGTYFGASDPRKDGMALGY